MSKNIQLVFFFCLGISVVLARDCKEIKNMPECNQAKCKYDFFAYRCLDILSQESSTTCQELNESNLCKQNLSCYWTTTGMRGSCNSSLDFDCAQFNENQSCQNVPQCYWSSTGMRGVCQNLGCQQFRDSQTCYFNKQCKWSSTGLSGACVSSEQQIY